MLHSLVSCVSLFFDFTHSRTAPHYSFTRTPFAFAAFAGSALRTLPTLFALLARAGFSACGFTFTSATARFDLTARFHARCRAIFISPLISRSALRTLHGAVCGSTTHALVLPRVLPGFTASLSVCSVALPTFLLRLPPRFTRAAAPISRRPLCGRCTHRTVALTHIVSLLRSRLVTHSSFGYAFSGLASLGFALFSWVSFAHHFSGYVDLHTAPLGSFPPGTHCVFWVFVSAGWFAASPPRISRIRIFFFSALRAFRLKISLTSRVFCLVSLARELFTFCARLHLCVLTQKFSALHSATRFSHRTNTHAPHRIRTLPLQFLATLPRSARFLTVWTPPAPRSFRLAHLCRIRTAGLPTHVDFTLGFLRSVPHVLVGSFLHCLLRFAFSAVLRHSFSLPASLRFVS